MTNSKTTSLELAQMLYSYAKEHYNDGGWDCVVECETVAEIAEMIEREGYQSFKEVLEHYEAPVSVWADRQADARYYEQEALGFPEETEKAPESVALYFAGEVVTFDKLSGCVITKSGLAMRYSDLDQHCKELVDNPRESLFVEVLQRLAGELHRNKTAGETARWHEAMLAAAQDWTKGVRTAGPNPSLMELSCSYVIGLFGREGSAVTYRAFRHAKGLAILEFERASGKPASELLGGSL